MDCEALGFRQIRDRDFVFGTGNLVVVARKWRRFRRAFWSEHAINMEPVKDSNKDTTMWGNLFRIQPPYRIAPANLAWRYVLWMDKIHSLASEFDEFILLR